MNCMSQVSGVLICRRHLWFSGSILQLDLLYQDVKYVIIYPNLWGYQDILTYQ